MNATSVVYITGTMALMVFLRSMQQLNVQHDKRRWVPPVSFGMAFCEVGLVVTYAHWGPQWWVIGSAGAGASAGCLIAMQVHKHLRGR